MLEKTLRRAGSDALKYFPVRLIPALTSLVTVPVFTNNIAKADYGNFYLVNSTSTLATSIATGWIASSIIRYYWIARKDGRKDSYTATTLWMTVAAVVVTSAIMGAVAWLLRGQLTPGLMRLVPVGIASFAVSALYTTLLNVMRAANRAKSFAVLSVSMTLTTTALALLWVWKAHWGAMGILAGGLVGHAVLIPFILRDVRKEGTLSPAAWDGVFLRDFASYGVPLMIAGLSGWVLVVADRYVIGFMRDAAEVGLYSVAYGLGEKIMQLATLPLILTMTPLLIETFEREGQEITQKVQSQFTRYFAMLTFPLLAGMAVAGADFMKVFTGREYQEAYAILAIVAGGVMCNSLAQLAGSGLGLHKRSKIIMSNTLAAAATNVVANLLTVGRFGYMAAAYNTLLAYGVLLTLTWIRTRPYMRWELPWGDLARIAGACAAMAAVLLVAFPGVSDDPMILLAQVEWGFVAYAIALVGLRAVRPAELTWAAEAPAALIARLRRGKDAS